MARARDLTRLVTVPIILACFLFHNAHAVGPVSHGLGPIMPSKSIFESAFKSLTSSKTSNPTSCYKDATGSTTSPFWMEKIKHQGISPFNSDPAGYKVFRNVKDYGAVGDGVHDDTAAINLAITSQNRCGGGKCSSSTVSPAIVYFPQGKYLISTPIIPYYYTQLIGDAKIPPTLLAAPTFDGMAVIDANPYIPGGGGAQYFQATNNFHRSIRNFVIDVRQVPPQKQQGTGIHWQVAQATSLMNIVFDMSAAPNTAHQGIWMENGSGGFMGDLVFNGGKYGIWGGNQQFTVRNITVNNAQIGVYSLWNWGWTYQDVKFNNCQVGFDIATGGLTVATQTTGAQAIIDAVVTDTPIFIRTSQPSNNSLAGSIVLNNVKLTNVPVAVGVSNGSIVLSGTSPAIRKKIISSWVQGNVYHRSNPNGQFTQGNVVAPHKAGSLLDAEGRIVSRGHPQYEDHDVVDFISARDYGAKGDGVTDDTAALQAIFDQFSACHIIFLDAGFYIVSSTLTIPAGMRLVGEAWSVLAGKGPAFQDQLNPQVAFRVGEKGSEQAESVTEITDVVFTTVGPAAGAIVVEWNVREPANVQAGAGMWDTHIRLAGSTGTNLEASTCPQLGTGAYDPCYAAFLSLHITPDATGYFEGTWVWLADHDLDYKDDEGQITVYAGRGILSESKGPVWMIGTASEHHVIYQYNLVGAKNHYMGLIQTESPYFQPKPAVPTPYRIDPAYNDPTPYEGNASSWALSVKRSHGILVFGAGLYSFFVNYSQGCLNTRNCQSQILNVDSLSEIDIYSLSTVASTYQLSVNRIGIVDQNDNVNGFASTISSWTSK